MSVYPTVCVGEEDSLVSSTWRGRNDLRFPFPFVTLVSPADIFQLEPNRIGREAERGGLRTEAVKSARSTHLLRKRTEPHAAAAAITAPGRSSWSPWANVSGTGYCSDYAFDLTD